MEENIGNKLSRILSGADKTKLKKSVDAVSELLRSEDGKKLKESLTHSDKKAILEKFAKMDAEEVTSKLQNVDASALKNLSVNDILKKLK